MLEEAAHELMAGKPGPPPTVGGAMLLPDSFAFRVKALDPAVGDGGAKHIAGKVAQHGLRPVAPRVQWT